MIEAALKFFAFDLLRDGAELAIYGRKDGSTEVCVERNGAPLGARHVASFDSKEIDGKTLPVAHTGWSFVRV